MLRVNPTPKPKPRASTYGGNTPGKRKLTEKDVKDMEEIERLANLELEDSDEDELILTADVDIDLDDDDEAPIGMGLGLGRGRVGAMKLVGNKFSYVGSNRGRGRGMKVPVKPEAMIMDDGADEERDRELMDTVVNLAEVKDKNFLVTVGVEGETGMESQTEDGALCPMKWMRTVGLDGEGGLQCVVKGGSIDGSEKTESIMADTIRNLTNIYQKRRKDIVDLVSGCVSTPLHGVKQLALEHGETLHVEANCFPNGYHRVELFSGSLRGLGEGMTRKIAAQMAAIDLLERIQLSGEKVKVPIVGFLPGWLTSNKIFRDLSALCRSKGLPGIKMMSRLNTNDEGKLDNERPPYIAECWVGDELATIAESEAEIFAKREAAKLMYQTLSDVEYRDTPYAIGQGCLTLSQLKDSGCKPIMSEYKKLWLLQNRVENGKFVIPEEEVGFDEQMDVGALEKDLGEMAEKASYKLMKNPLQITVHRSKKFKLDEDDEDDSTRAVSVEKKDEADSDSDF